MAFAFRPRFRTAKGFTTDESRFDVTGPGATKFTIASTPDGTNLRAPGWLSVRHGGFASADEAREVAGKLRRQLLVAGTMRWMGFDFGHDATTSGMFKAARAEAEEHAGCRIRDNVHGLDVFEEDPVMPTKFLSISATGTVTEGTDLFARTMGSVNEAARTLSNRQLVAMELLNDSMFPASTDSQFLTRVSAMEVLCERGHRTDEEVAALTSLAASLKDLKLSAAAHDSLRQHILGGKKESIADACRRRIRDLLGPDKVKLMERIYKARSRLVHAGDGRGQTSEISGEALSLATDLLRTEIGL